MSDITGKGLKSLKYSCGCSDRGQTVDDLFVGKVEIKWCDGSSYNGEYNEHRSKDYPNEVTGCNGYGRFTFPNGDWHEGNFLNNLAHGKGTFFYAEKNIYWRGSWVNNSPEGIGTYFRKNPITDEDHFLYNGECVDRVFFEQKDTSDKCTRPKLLELQREWMLEDFGEEEFYDDF